MTTDLDLLRARSDLPDVVMRYGVKLRKVGAQLAGLCPFHREKSPSFYVHPIKQVFKCHGCGAGGDVFSFVRQIERVDFRTAMGIVATVPTNRRLEERLMPEWTMVISSPSRAPRLASVRID